MINLIIGQKTSLTATLVDSLNAPVTPIDSSDILWSVDDPTIISIGDHPHNPSETGTLHLPFKLSGPLVRLEALAIGTTNVTATYNNGSVDVIQVTQVVVAPNAVAAITITQGPVY